MAYAEALRRSRSVSRPYKDSFGSSTRQIGHQWMSLRKILRYRVRLQLSQSRFLFLLLAMSSRVYLFFPPRGHDLRPPSVTVSTHISASIAVAFQSSPMPNARMSLSTMIYVWSHMYAIGSLFLLLLPRPLNTAPSSPHQGCF